MKLPLTLLKCCLFTTLAFSQQSPQPFLKWSFDGTDSLISVAGAQRINPGAYNCQVVRTVSPSGKGLGLDGSSCLVVTNALRNPSEKALVIEFLFKGKSLQFVSIPDQRFRIHLSYRGLGFRTSHRIKSGSITTHDLQLPLNGSGINTYSYLTNGQWHHLIFSVNLQTGSKRIWIDGQSPTGFQARIPVGTSLVTDRNDGFRFTDNIDELAFFSTELTEAYIRLRANRLLPREQLQALKTNTPALDSLDFAPGYPQFQFSSIEQLINFPLPRYNAGSKLNRNVNWMDIEYLHRLPNKGNEFTTGRTDAEAAVALTEELVRNWNYYIDIPVLRWKSEQAERTYENPKTIPGALVKLANQHPEWPVSGIVIQLQGNPRHIGDSLNRPYVLAQNLPARYYLRDKNNGLIKNKNQLILSPLMDLDIIQKDARLTAYYLNNMLKHLQQPPFLLSENGEVFGHAMSGAVLEKDPRVWADFKRSGLTLSEYSGRFQYRRDSVYKAEIMRETGFAIPAYSVYNISAIQPAYWPDYAQRKAINQWKSKEIFSTPDFYPRTPDNWSMSRGAFNGFGIIANGRKTEIEQGDRNFSPFVSAGWGAEEKNIRPAQWLALLKAMVMLGAEHFYTGFFNITGSGGKWPNGIGPYDPRGYIYQAALPGYAQAIRSIVPEFFDQGKLLDPENSGLPAFRYKTPADNQLVLVRQVGKKFLIYGSIQPNSNLRGNVPDEQIVPVSIENNRYELVFRRQGSMYVLDLSGKAPMLIQLDQWHQKEHPSFWSRHYSLDAELFTGKKGAVDIQTRGILKNDLTQCSTWIELPPGASVQYKSIALRKGIYAAELKREGGLPGVRLEASGKRINPERFTIDKEGELQLELHNSTSQPIFVDRIIFKRIE